MSEQHTDPIGPDGFTRLAGPPTSARATMTENQAEKDHIAQAVTTLREWERRAHRGTVTLDPEEISDLADLLSRRIERAERLIERVRAEQTALEELATTEITASADMRSAFGLAARGLRAALDPAPTQPKEGESCVVCDRPAPRHGGLCCFHKYDEQPMCDGCAVDGWCPGCECGDHQWLDRPESDTRECLICGAEVSG